MAAGFEGLRPHRRLMAFLETALDCLEEAVALNATLGVLPHWAEMAETLAALFGPLEREGPHLAPLREDEWAVEAAAEDEHGQES